MTIWFSSDHHFDQASLFEKYVMADGSKVRPFNSLEEMNERMVEEHNKLVKPQDHWYCLGDFTMVRESIPKWGPRLNGHKRILLGNHDIFRVQEYLKAGFEKVAAIRVLDGMWFTHIAVAPWCMGTMRCNVHGHSHRAKPLFYTAINPDATGANVAVKYINISVENTNYRPVSLEQLSQWSRK